MKRKEVNLEKKRVDLIRESIEVYLKYQEIKSLYKNGKLDFAFIQDFVDDRGRSCLFRLKELSHELFRSDENINHRERLFDMLVGYLFHEAMKVRETLYQIQFYKPKLDELSRFRSDIAEEIKGLTGKAKKRLKDGLKEIGILIKELRVQIEELLRYNKANYLIPRFLIEEKKRLLKVLGKKKYTELLKSLYGSEEKTLLFKAAKSYLESQYYNEAKRLFKNLLSIDSRDQEILFFFKYASAFSFYFSNNSKKALSLAEEALSMNAGYKEYKRHLSSLINEIKREKNERRL